MGLQRMGGQVYGKITVERDDGDVDVEVSGHYEPAEVGGWDCPSYATSVELEWSAIELTEEEAKKAEELLLNIAEGRGD